LNINLFGILALAALIAVGVALIVLGAIGWKGRRDWLLRALAMLAIVVGLTHLIILAVAMGMRREPWDVMLALFAIGAGAAAFIFWAGALADCLLNEPNDGWGKLVWVLAIVFTFVFGAGIYYLGQRPRRVTREKE
jgi:ABC-type transport system involved in multi-copper enzyme maturation permease subunit